MIVLAVLSTIGNGKCFPAVGLIVEACYRYHLALRARRILRCLTGSTQLEGEAFRVLLSAEKTKSINTSVISGETKCALLFFPLLLRPIVLHAGTGYLINLPEPLLGCKRDV